MHARLDHLVIAAASLAEGVAWCEATLGVAPGPGGSHPLMGTHNRLLHIASDAFPSAYAEIIAVEPGRQPSRPGTHRWFDLDDATLQAGLAQHGPRLIHCVARVPDASAASQALAREEHAHIDRGHLLEASRDTAAGRLEWQITVRDDGQRLFYGALPTLIQWGPVHPTDSMPVSGLALRSLPPSRRSAWATCRSKPARPTSSRCSTRRAAPSRSNPKDSDPMLSLTEIAWFALASLLLALTPGPNMIYCVSRTLIQGRRAGLISLGGVLMAFLVHLFAAALGLTALLLAVPLAFDAIRMAGAAYLLWLAWQAVRPGGNAPFEARVLPTDPPAKLFRMGFLTNLLNPKVAMFYLSFFPQFIHPERGSVLLQSMQLGMAQMASSAAVNTVMIVGAASITAVLSQSAGWLRAQRYVMGSVLAALAVRVALTERK